MAETLRTHTGQIADLVKNGSAELVIKHAVSFEDAERIFGADYFDGASILHAFGVFVHKDLTPPIPFSYQELEQAKQLNQMLILRVTGTIDNPLTMENMNRLPSVQTFLCTDVIPHSRTMAFQNEYLFTKDMPRPGWALVSKTLLANSINKDYRFQSFLLAQYLKKTVFANKILPSEYGGLDNIALGLKLRRTAVETMYDTIMYFVHTGIRLLPDVGDWGRTLDTKGKFVTVGFFDKNKQIDLYCESSDKSDRDTGVCFSRRI